MTLFRQLFVGASLLFLLVLAGVEVIYLSNARFYLQEELESHSQDGATSLSLWLATVKPFDDPALIETVVNTAFDRGYYQSIRVVSVSGTTLVDKELPTAQGAVPAWFTRLFPLHPPSAEALISVGWRQLGRVYLSAPTRSEALAVYRAAITVRLHSPYDLALCKQSATGRHAPSFSRSRIPAARTPFTPAGISGRSASYRAYARSRARPD